MTGRVGCRSLHGDHIVVHRLASREDGDLGVGAGVGKELGGLFRLLLLHVLPVVDVDEGGPLEHLIPGQLLQHLVEYQQQLL